MAGSDAHIYNLISSARARSFIENRSQYLTWGAACPRRSMRFYLTLIGTLTVLPSSSVMRAVHVPAASGRIEYVADESAIAATKIFATLAQSSLSLNAATFELLLTRKSAEFVTFSMSTLVGVTVSAADDCACAGTTGCVLEAAWPLRHTVPSANSTDATWHFTFGAINAGSTNDWPWPLRY